MRDNYLIPGYKPGSDITIIDAVYRRPMIKDDGKWDKGYMTIVYRDNLLGEKKVHCIENPYYEYYIAKPEYRTSYPRLFIERDHVYAVAAPYKSLEKDIAEKTNNMKFFMDNIESGNRASNQKLHQHPDVFGSDMHIEDYYRAEFTKWYPNNIGQISKSFLDIEVDGINMAGDFPALGECPINAVTVVFKHIKKVYTFLLRNEKNPLISEFEKSVNPELFIELKDFIREAVGGPTKEAKYGLTDFEYSFLFYDEDKEIDLIADVFNSVNTYKPDFVLAWNMAFDIPYMINRIRQLGYSAEDIICHSDFPVKKSEYYIDERAKNDPAERGDHAIISSYSVYIDQLIHFASRRKGQTKFNSMSLDAIGQAVAGVRKLDYKDITTNIVELPYKNYKTFVFYNIMDTIVQNCIECITQDVEYIFGKCIMNNTRYHKGHRQTVYLTNRGTKEFYNDEFIMGNNCNRGNPPPDKKFPGAFVADPQKINDYSKMRINGVPVNIYNNLDDFDFASLYPSLLRQFNIAAHTQIGMVIMNQLVHAAENKRGDDKWSRAGEFMEDFQSHVWLEFCTRWLHLGNYLELYKDVNHYYTNIVMPSNCIHPYNKEGLINPITFYGEDVLPNAIKWEDEKYDIHKYATPNFSSMGVTSFGDKRTQLIAIPNQSFKVV